MITISSMSLLSVQDKTVCGAQEFVGNGSVFSANVNQLVMNLSVEAPKFDGFSVGSVNNGNVTVYGLAQCVGNLWMVLLVRTVWSMRFLTLVRVLQKKKEGCWTLVVIWGIQQKSSIIIRLSLLETVIKVSLVPMNFFIFCSVFPSSNQMGY